MLLWYWQESVQKNAMKSSLGDCDAQLWEFSQGESVGGIIKEEKRTALFIFTYTRADCWDIRLERLGLDFVVVFSRFYVSYILKTWMLFVLDYTPRVINHDILWFQGKVFKILLYVYVPGIKEIGHGWDQGPTCVCTIGISREYFGSLGWKKHYVLKESHV